MPSRYGASITEQHHFSRLSNLSPKCIRTKSNTDTCERVATDLLHTTDDKVKLWDVLCGKQEPMATVGVLYG